MNKAGLWDELRAGWICGFCSQSNGFRRLVWLEKGDSGCVGNLYEMTGGFGE